MQDDGLTQNLLLLQTHLHSLELNVSIKLAKFDSLGGKLQAPDRQEAAEYERQRKGQVIYVETRVLSRRALLKSWTLLDAFGINQQGALHFAGSLKCCADKRLSELVPAERSRLSQRFEDPALTWISMWASTEMCPSLGALVVNQGSDGSAHKAKSHFSKIRQKKGRKKKRSQSCSFSTETVKQRWATVVNVMTGSLCLGILTSHFFFFFSRFRQISLYFFQSVKSSIADATAAPSYKKKLRWKLWFFFLVRFPSYLAK